MNDEIRKKHRFCIAQKVLLLMMVVCFFTVSGSHFAYASDTESYLESDIEYPENLNRTGYDVVYVIDNSRSVWSQQSIRNQAFKNISNLAVGSDINVGVVYFADHVYSTLGLTSMKTQEGSQKVLQFLNMTSQDNSNIDTNIGNALEAAITLLEDQDPSREKIIILFSDGINENLAGDLSYTESANEKTSEQAKKLKQMDIPIYCVYLQKERNDEEYLKGLVNYFSNEKDYTEERFEKVKEESISELSSTFADVFYAMQKNMKYRKIQLDSLGRMQFYVPSLGIKQLRVYLDGDLKEGTKLIPSTDSEHSKWTDGSAAFLVYNDPAPGEWSIEVNSSDLEDVHGTVVYYASLSAQAELINIEDEERNYQLFIHFYDEDGLEIAVDDKAEIEVTLNYVEEDGTESVTPLEMAIDDGKVISEKFAMTSYGKYDYSVNLSYKDFIDLNYSIGGITVEKTAPIPNNMSGREFIGEKTKEGIVFGIKESSLWSDPEGEEVFVTGVTQLNAVNPVIYEQRDGYVYITAKKASDIEFSLKLEDTSGMVSNVTVGGRVKNQGAIRIMQIGKVFLQALIVILIVAFVLRRKQWKEKLKRYLDYFRQISSECDSIYSFCKSKTDELNDFKETMYLYLHGKSESVIPGIIEMSSGLTEEMQKIYGVSEYICDGYEENIVNAIDTIFKEIEKAKMDMVFIQSGVDVIEKNPKPVKKSVKRMEEYCKKGEEIKAWLDSLNARSKEAAEKFEQELERLGDAGNEIAEMLATEIQCKLKVQDISALAGTRGSMGVRDISGNYIQGYYGLDDIRLLGGKGSLKEQLGTLGIYVCGYEDEETQDLGLKLQSIKKFRLKQSTEKTYQMMTEAVLLKGNTYDLMVNSRVGEVCMKLIVE